jgi:hypothetical protein
MKVGDRVSIHGVIDHELNNGAVRFECEDGIWRWVEPRFLHVENPECEFKAVLRSIKDAPCVAVAIGIHQIAIPTGILPARMYREIKHGDMPVIVSIMRDRPLNELERKDAEIERLRARIKELEGKSL